MVGEDPISGVAGFGYSVNEAMLELTKHMDFYHRNWQEFAKRTNEELWGREWKCLCATDLRLRYYRLCIAASVRVLGCAP